MKISEHYSRAIYATSLKSEPRTTLSASDVLGAAGMAAQQHHDALLLWSVFYGGKTGQKLALVEGLERKLCTYMMANRLKGNPSVIAREVVAHYMLAKCSACDGVGYQLIPHSIARSDDTCPECMGTGKPITPNDDAWQWLYRYVATLLSIAATKVMGKISLDL
jgi:hypothetical protein